MSGVDLSLVETELLIRELQKRYEHSLIAGIRHTSEFRGSNDQVHQIRYNGNFYMLLGLHAAIAFKIQQENPAVDPTLPDEEGS